MEITLANGHYSLAKHNARDINIEHYFFRIESKRVINNDNFKKSFDSLMNQRTFVINWVFNLTIVVKPIERIRYEKNQ